MTENVGIDQPQENHKLNTIDFNIKNFLLDMRSKHNMPGTGNNSSSTQNLQQNSNLNNVISLQNSMSHINTDFINIIDEQ